MDIHSKGEYPSDMLSNFAPNSFEIDGVKCNSMEGFLQSLKYKSKRRQIQVCLLVGKDAKKAGSRKRIWKLTHNVWWQRQRIKRQSPEFSALIGRAYDKLFANENFAKALFDSGDEELTHSMGRHEPFKTILTEEEFVTQLKRLRSLVKQ